jgi:hypothetical protein
VLSKVIVPGTEIAPTDIGAPDERTERFTPEVEPEATVIVPWLMLDVLLPLVVSNKIFEAVPLVLATTLIAPLCDIFPLLIIEILPPFAF